MEALTDSKRRQILLQLGLWAGLFPIATGRWGTHISLVGDGLYVCDVLLALGILGLIRLATQHSKTISPRALLASAVLAVYILCEFFAGSEAMPQRLRDLAPFVYLISIPVFMQALTTIDTTAVVRSIWAALWIHAVWAVPASFGLLKPVTLLDSVFGLPAFQLRKDYDGPVLIATAILGLSVRSSGTRLRGALALSLLSLSAIPMLGSRATLFALLSALMYMAILRFRSLIRLLITPTTIVVVAFVISSLLVVAIVAPHILVSNLLAKRLGFAGESSAALGAQGSAFGRKMAWKLVWEATVDDPSRIAVGWGPGAEILRDTGALKYLSGDPTVRAPHNGFLHLFARYGALGCLVWLGCLLLLLSSARSPRPPPDTNLALQLLGGSLAASLLAASVVGVILESPFGAMTIFLGLTLERVSRCSGQVYLSARPTGSPLDAWRPDTRGTQERRLGLYPAPYAILKDTES
jgi:O-Antigen ligase